MSNQLTHLRDSLIDVLRTISTANGYATDAGANVKSGWFEDIINTQRETSPVIVVQRGKNQPPIIEAGELVLQPGYTVIAAVNVGLADYDQLLDQLEQDIYTALVQRGTRNLPWAPYGAHRIIFDEPLAAPPGGGHNWASIAIRFNLRTTIPLTH